MPRKRKVTEKGFPEDKQILRCWVEILEVQTGSKRELPLTGVRKIHIPRKNSDPRLPDEDVLELEDGEAKIEAKDLDDLAAKLREKYPDEAFERRLFKVRDLGAEKRRADALNGLIDIIAKAAADDFLREEAAKRPS